MVFKAVRGEVWDLTKQNRSSRISCLSHGYDDHCYPARYPGLPRMRRSGASLYATWLARFSFLSPGPLPIPMLDLRSSVLSFSAALFLKF